jgi:hypothetical protein
VLQYFIENAAICIMIAFSSFPFSVTFPSLATAQTVSWDLFPQLIPEIG